jgi:hypothetical protein
LVVGLIAPYPRALTCDIISVGMWHCQQEICVILGISAMWYGACCGFVHTDSKNRSTGYKKICLKRAKERTIKNEHGKV